MRKSCQLRFQFTVVCSSRLRNESEFSSCKSDKKQTYISSWYIFFKCTEEYIARGNEFLSLFTLLSISLIKQPAVSLHNLCVPLCSASFSILSPSLLPTVPLACHMYTIACLFLSHSLSLFLSLSPSLSLFQHCIPLCFLRRVFFHV